MFPVSGSKGEKCETEKERKEKRENKRFKSLKNHIFRGHKKSTGTGLADKTLIFLSLGLLHVHGQPADGGAQHGVRGVLKGIQFNL